MKYENRERAENILREIDKCNNKLAMLGNWGHLRVAIFCPATPGEYRIKVNDDSHDQKELQLTKKYIISINKLTINKLVALKKELSKL